MSTADNTSFVDQNNLFLRPPSSQQEPQSQNFQNVQTISRPSYSDAMSQSKTMTFEQVCHSSSKNSNNTESIDKKDNSDKTSRKGKPIRKR